MNGSNPTRLGLAVGNGASRQRLDNAQLEPRSRARAVFSAYAGGLLTVAWLVPIVAGTAMMGAKLT
jgi:hypothetical protein